MVVDTESDIIGSDDGPIVESALRLAEKGFNVFPLVQYTKVPAMGDYSTIATTDPGKIKKWWARNPNFNIGIFTGRFNGGKEALIGIDVDNKGEKKGDEVLAELKKSGLEFPVTFTQVTPTGGKHLIYKNKEAVKQGVNVLGEGLDTRSHGGYLVGAGSVIEGKKYYAFDLDVAQIPEPILTKFKKPTPKSDAEGSVVSSLQGIERAREYLLSVAPALQGEGGDHHTFVVACKLKDLGLDKFAAFALMAEHWNPRCEPPWDAQALMQKIENAYSYGSEPVGVLAPQNVFPKVEDEKNLDPVERLNQEYALVTMGSKSMVAQFVKDDVRFIQLPTFHSNLANKKLVFGDRSVPLSRYWMSDPKRRSYAEVRFYPKKIEDPSVLNLWRGFKVKANANPDPKGKKAVDDLLGHAFENICEQKDELFNWLIGFFAHLIQKPWEKPRVAVVFRGRKGVGKNVFIERIGYLLGRYHVLAANPRYIIGNFNGHLENCLLLTLDEAFWSGDKRAEGVLKDLITGRTMLIEKKGFEPYVAQSFNRTVIIGNDEWLVPASHDERRFAVFEVGNKRQNDFQFFDSLIKGMENYQGYEYLFHYLNSFDLSKVNLDLAPKTQALGDQKFATLGVLAEWVYSCLSDGRFTEEDKHTSGELHFKKDEAFSSYRKFCRDKGVSRWLDSERNFFNQLRLIFPNAKSFRKREEGERVWMYMLPSIEKCRKQFDKYIGHETEWEGFEI